MELDQSSKLLLNLLQKELPLLQRPYRLFGEKLGCSEDSVLERLGRLKAAGLLRQISAIFDTRSLGYHSSLVACKADELHADEVAARINAHPGVSHNYARNNAFNLWFTIAVPPTSDLEAHIRVLQQLSGALAMRLLPTLRLFKIGVKLDMTDGAARAPEEDLGYSEVQREREKEPLTARDIAFVSALQDDMQITAEPFAAVASKLGVSVAELLEWCRRAVDNGRMRRMAGIVNHRRAGFGANGMGVWRVPENRIDEIGQLFARQPQVTHCYLRPSYPDWPFNIFTMAHAKSVEACEQIMAQMSSSSGISERATLYSHKEYKKIRLKYFTGEIEAWEKAHDL